MRSLGTRPALEAMRVFSDKLLYCTKIIIIWKIVFGIYLALSVLFFCKYHPFLSFMGVFICVKVRNDASFDVLRNPNYFDSNFLLI